MTGAPKDPGAGGSPEQPDYRALARAAVARAEMHPRDVAVLLHAARMLLQAGDIARSVHFARQAAAVDPTSFSTLRSLSGILDAAGERQEAISLAKEAVRIAPAEAEPRLHLGALLAAERNWQQAAEHLSVHVASVTATPRGWRLLSSVLHQAGDTERATEAAREAIAAAPDTIEYRLNLASLLTVRALYHQALTEIYAALAQAPANAAVWRALSATHAELGQLAAALRAAEKAVELAGDDPRCHAHLAHVAALCDVPVAKVETQAEQTIWSLPPRRPSAPGPMRRPLNLFEDVALRWQVIYAIMLRDIRTRFGHTRLGYFWAIMEPISHLMTLETIFFTLNHAPPPVGDNLFLFYITGLVPYLMFSHVSLNIMGAAEANNTMLQLPIVKRTDIMVAHALRQFATELCVGIVIFSTAGLLGQRGVPADPLTALAAVILIWLLAVGVGAFNLVVVEMFPSYETIYAALLRLLYFGSGIYYSPIAMPDWVRAVLEYNPVLQGIEFFRAGFFPQYDPHWLDVDYLLTWVVASIGTGFALERSMRSRMVIYS